MITASRNPDAAWPPDYRWIEDFWDVVLPDVPGRVLQVLAPSDIVALDGSALALLQEPLRARGERLEFRYVHVETTEPEIAHDLMADRDILFVGRTRALHSSRVRVYASELAASSQGHFVDKRDGRRGRAVDYGARAFLSHELRVPPVEGRCDVDYALLSYCEVDVGFAVRRMVGFCGVTAPATWMLTRIMTDANRRRQLAASLRALLPWSERLRPEKRFDICIRLVLDGRDALINLLNDERFEYQVVAATIGEDATVLLEDALEVELRPDRARGGGRVSAGTADLRILDLRFRVLRTLAEADGPLTTDGLCLKLGLLAGGESPQTVRKVRGRLIKAVHDLNGRFAKEVPALHGKHPVHHGPKGYYLEGMKAKVRRE